MRNCIACLQQWLNNHPKLKYALVTAEGAMGGTIGSKLTGWANDTTTFTGTGLKRTFISALFAGAIAAYNCWKTPPTIQSK